MSLPVASLRAVNPLVDGKFITLEGGEGAGKSTHAALLAEGLRKADKDVTVTREPGGAPGAEEIRALLVEGAVERWDAMTEALLHVAARRQHLKETIEPALDAGHWVVCDRFADSTVAYQGYGRGLDLGSIEVLNAIVTQGVKPKRTFLLDLSPEEGLKRVGKPQLSLPLDGQNKGELGRADKEGQRRFEDEPIVFHRKVRQGYLELAKRDPERFIVLDANRPFKELEAAIWENVQSLLVDS